MKIPIILGAVFLASAHAVVFGQPVTVNDISGTSTVFVFRTKQIQKMVRPEVTKLDLEKIKSNFPSIQAEYSKLGFTREETLEAVAAGWTYVRLSSPLKPNQSISSRSFVEFMTSEFLADNGKVEVTSSPAGARVIINGNDFGSAPVRRWFSVKEEISVVCEKEGFAKVEKVCPVAVGSNKCPCEMAPIASKPD